MGRITFIIFLLFFILSDLSSQVKVRLLTDNNPDHLFLSVNEGWYQADPDNGTPIRIAPGDLVAVSKYDGRLTIKVRGKEGFIADSVIFTGMTGHDSFSITAGVEEPVNQLYTGDLYCYPDLGSILLINDCDLEDYIAGVVRAEGGSGKTEEYFRTQAVIARTYTYRNLGKHLSDRYNLCDDTHCQAFNGITGDTLIINAVKHTKDLVIVTPDSNLINSAFHSNCGGETSPSEYVWLAALPYLVKVKDPFCLNSRNAKWEKSVTIDDWTGMLADNGLSGLPRILSDYNFTQTTRSQLYKAGAISLPLRTIREYLDLRSSFFSVSASGDSLKIFGRGYGHGVGLCQEGAMVMASKGKDFREIINFYYPGVFIMNVAHARKDIDIRKVSAVSSPK